MRKLLATACALAAGAVLAQDAAVLAHGQQVYGRCLACHAIDQHRTGPAHCGLFGRRAGSARGFGAYSQALKQSGIVWNERTLDRFLADPMTAVPGTHMAYLGVTDAKERADLIAYLQESTRPGSRCTPAD